jgi:hypothetical protein
MLPPEVGTSVWRSGRERLLISRLTRVRKRTANLQIYGLNALLTVKDRVSTRYNSHVVPRLQRQICFVTLPWGRPEVAPAERGKNEERFF